MSNIGNWIKDTISWKLILVILLLAMCGFSIYPPAQKCKLGIDLAGGTSLLYQIDTSDLQDWEKRTIATDMIRILRQRVDPNNKRNLIWRIHGNDRIEIQMPLATKETRQLHRDYRDQLDKLQNYNLDMSMVDLALVRPAGMDPDEYRASRSKKFDELAGGSESRRALLKELAQAYDNLEQGRVKLNTVLKKIEPLQEKLVESQINQNRADALSRRWGPMDDPNRAAELKRIAGDDKTKQDLLKQYVLIRTELTPVRDAIIAKPDGLQAKFDQARENLKQANINISRLQEFLEIKSKSKRREEINRFEEAYPKAAQDDIEKLVIAYDAYAKVAGRLDDPETLIKLLRGVGILEFRILPRLNDETLSEEEIKTYLDRLENQGPLQGAEKKNASYLWEKIKNPEDFNVPNAITSELAGTKYVLCSNRPGETMLHSTTGDTWRLQKARLGNDQYGGWSIDFTFNEIGANKFWRLTKDNLQRPLCILLDNEAISAPNIQSVISRSGQITGKFTQTEALNMVDKLNAGSLPARLGDQPISINSIGPTAGRNNLEAGLHAGFYGLAVVAIFMFFYYLIAGCLADAALFMNILLVIGVMAFSRATFTMPGIAGLILTIGMAVDANVLIFERIREEQSRGSSLRIAIKNGYERAFRTILDANLTTLIVALILYVKASEEIKGFSITLMIGIVSSMFTALFVTRMIFDFLTDNRILKNKLVMLQIVKNPQVKWMGKRPIFWTVSSILVIAGWLIFAIGRGESDTSHKILTSLGLKENTNSKYSIEFTGGTSIHVILTPEGAEKMFAPEELASLTPQEKQLALREKVEQGIRQEGDQMNNPLLAAARVQQIGPPENLEFEILTTETNLVDVTLEMGAENKQNAEEIQNQIRQTATAMGDQRLEDSTVTSTDKPGVFLMVTRQTNINRVTEAVLRAFPMKVTLTLPADADMSADAVAEALKTKAEDWSISNLEKASVRALDEDKFLITLRRIDSDTLRRVLEQAFPQSTYTTDNPVNFTTKTDPIVSNAVRRALADKLVVLTNLNPTNVAAEPVTAELISRKPYLSPYRGRLFLEFQFGADRSETKARLEKRLELSSIKTEFEKYGQHKFIWFPPQDKSVTNDAPLKGIEVVVSSDIMHQSASAEEWNSFKDNEVKRFQDILSLQTSLPRVTQIDPSVGHKSMRDALIAIILSLVAIVAYIWFRFGNFRFGLAAVVALIHDVSISMGMVAATAWLSETHIGRLLMIQDFKIDLPMIAAFLTVIGYSLNDTIVVFDRIRENRGKLATLSLNIINDSINQTLSRTILTSFTTLIVLIIMYIWGGPGLRSFNFVMIIGIVVGTYSSIGIASPLLYGAKADTSKKAGSSDKENSSKNNNRK